PVEQIDAATAIQGQEINAAKELLAFEVTKLVHGEEEAVKARQAARALFAGGKEAGAIPTTQIEKGRLQTGIPVLDLLIECGLTSSKSEGRRLIQQGGLTINEQKIDDFELIIDPSWLKDDKILVRKGKKVHHHVLCK
ncbi:MAG: tyrosine--tRNA ligase, partial [Eubacteriales bacterium]|nr:tyrosine--tRNA ligase [Eubacteriales bacterium]